MRRDKFHPGWKMTEPQFGRYWREVKRVCVFVGAMTDAQRDDARKQIHLRAFKHEKSAKEINHLEGFDDFISAVEAICDPTNLAKQLRQMEMPRARAIKSIRGRFPEPLIQHLLVHRFSFAVWLRNNYPEHTGKTISAHSRRGPAPVEVVAEYRQIPPGAPALDDLNNQELADLRNTLARQFKPAQVAGTGGPSEAAFRQPENT